MDYYHIYYSLNNTFDEHCGSEQMIAFAGSDGLMWLGPRFIPYNEYCLGQFDENTYDEITNLEIRNQFSIKYLYIRT